MSKLVETYFCVKHHSGHCLKELYGKQNGGEKKHITRTFFLVSVQQCDVLLSIILQIKKQQRDRALHLRHLLRLSVPLKQIKLSITQWSPGKHHHSTAWNNKLWANRPSPVVTAAEWLIRVSGERSASRRKSLHWEVILLKCPDTYLRSYFEVII